MQRRLVHSALALAVASLLLVGCSDDDEPSACGELQDVADDVRGLTSTDLIAEGTDEVRDDVDDLTSEWDEVRDAAGDQFGDELDALESALSDVGSTLDDLGEGSLDEIEDELDTEIDAVRAAYDELTTAVSDELGDCDLSADS
jgi:hypothetical protein